MTKCQSYDFLCVVHAMYVAFGGSLFGGGWMKEMVENNAITGAGGLAGQGYADGAKSYMWNFGAFLGNRFAAFDNIVWMLGGDYGSGGTSGTFTAPQKAAVDQLMLGIKSIAGTSYLYTGHWSRPSLATDVALTSGFDLESVYSNTETARWTRAGYAHAPALPTFGLENTYEAASGVSAPYRRFLWWQVTAGGAAGYVYGNDGGHPPQPIFLFDTDWEDQLDSQGAEDAARINTFLRTLPWQNLVPSGLGGMSTLVTAGGGTAVPQSTDYVSACATLDGRWLVAYVPPAHTGDITVATSVMATRYRARWLNPTSGAFTLIGTGFSPGSHTLTPPGSNGGPGSYTDWVLVLDTGDLLSNGYGR
jgi:hypothetical protein